MRWLCLLLLLAACTTASEQATMQQNDARYQYEGTLSHRNHQFAAVAAATYGATALDVYTTFAALHGCRKCREGNPLVSPIVARGQLFTSIVMGGIETLVLVNARHNQRRGANYWWLVPTLHAASHGLAGGLNLRFIF